MRSHRPLKQRNRHELLTDGTFRWPGKVQMILSLLFALSVAEEEGPGIHGTTGEFLPLLPTDKVNGVALLPDYPGKKIPIQRLFRVVSAYDVKDESAYGLIKVFGQIANVKDEKDFVTNFTSYGVGGRLSNEEQTTFMHFCELDGQIDPQNYRLTVWAEVSANNGLNYSVLLFNEEVNFYEVVDVKNQIGAVVLYAFFIGVVAYILYIIFAKKKETQPATKTTSKKQVKSYADELGVSQEAVKRTGSSGRLGSNSPARKKSPAKGGK